VSFFSNYIIFLHIYFFSLEAHTPESLAKRTYTHTLIYDYKSALKESQMALSIYPFSMDLQKESIRVFALLGQEKAMMQAWHRYVENFPEQISNKELMEEMAWGVIKKASLSSSLIMREMALLAAYFSQDTKGVAILYGGMKDSNYIIRATAVKLACECRDNKLIIEIQNLFKKEKSWSVRKKIIKAIGKMKIREMKSTLENLVVSEESIFTEKLLASEALLNMVDKINDKNLEKLVSSPYSGLRRLACQIIAHFLSFENINYLLVLAYDPHAEVRLEALQALGQLKSKTEESKIIEIARKSIQEGNRHIAITGAWLLTLYVPKEGETAFKFFLADSRKDVRRLAAAALSSTGAYGSPLMLEQFRTHSDPYVRLNIAIGLIGQQIVVKEVCQFLKEILEGEKEKWTREAVGIFQPITPACFSKYKEDALSSPEFNDHIVRLELLNILAICSPLEAEQALRSYVVERAWGISATAASVLLMEGDESTIQLVRNLMEDSQPSIRLQAAFVLALWGREENAIETLEMGYIGGSREIKAKILEAIGRIGATRSIPFLMQALQEPSQTLRLIAAIALIQCLNH
jgi:HEAT repeat protein